MDTVINLSVSDAETSPILCYNSALQNYDDEGEFVAEDEEKNYTGGDRKQSLRLHRDEIQLLKEVGPCNEKSTTVLVGGNIMSIIKATRVLRKMELSQ